MCNDQITTCTVLEGSTIVLMARVVDTDNARLTQATTDTIQVYLYDVTNASYAVDSSGVADTSGDPIDTPVVADTIFDTLQTDSRWSKDSTGYNFAYKFVPPIKEHRYEVRIKIVDTNGDPLVIVYELKVK